MILIFKNARHIPPKQAPKEGTSVTASILENENLTGRTLHTVFIYAKN